MRKVTDFPYLNTGRWGNVVIYKVNNQLLIRSYRPPANPRTPCQQSNRSLHRFVNQVSAQTKPFRAFCFQHHSVFNNTHNAFISIQKMWLNKLAGRLENELVKAMLWSTGKLKSPQWICFERDQKFRLSWEVHEEGTVRSELSYQVLWIAWHSKNSSWNWKINACSKQKGYCELDLPDQWHEGEGYVWLIFYDPKRAAFSRSHLLIIPGEVDRVQKEYSIRNSSSHSVCENLVLYHWLESRKLNGKERSQYLWQHKRELEWRPWLINEE